jgi:ectoine hydroxylase-related dioxygenase (phytanoyl-CoA dioxygenase family)
MTSELDATGVVHCPGAAPADEVRAMRDCLWEAVHALGGLVDEDGARRPGPGTANAMAEVVQRSAFDVLEVHLARTLDEIFGAGAWQPASGIWRGVALPNLPGASSRAPWRVPHTHWHVDEPTRADRDQAHGLGAFVFLDRVVAGGGATVVMTGSPRRLRALAAELAPDRALTLEESTAGLARVEPWVHQLLLPERHLRIDDGCVSAGIPLRVVELTGEPGDVVLMDLRCLHAPSANVGVEARLVVKMACMNLR